MGSGGLEGEREGEREREREREGERGRQGKIEGYTALTPRQASYMFCWLF